MKRFLCVILSAALLLGLAACGEKPAVPAGSEEKQEETYDANGNLISCTE